MWELLIDKKLEVRKIDTELNINDCLTKLVLDYCFRALIRQMGLWQARENETNESKKGEVHKSKEQRAEWAPNEPKSR